MRNNFSKSLSSSFFLFVVKKRLAIRGRSSAIAITIKRIAERRERKSKGIQSISATIASDTINARNTGIFEGKFPYSRDP